MGLFKKTEAQIAKEEKKEEDRRMEMINAKAALQKARQKSLVLIKMQVDDYKKRDEKASYVSSAEHSKLVETRTKQSVRNAYYALALIEKIELQLEEYDAASSMASVTNEIANALKLINHVQKKAEKPHLTALKFRMNKMNKKSDKGIKTAEKIEETLKNAISTDDLVQVVDDKVVLDILNGANPMQCLKEDEEVWDQDLAFGDIDFGDLDLSSWANNEE